MKELKIAWGITGAGDYMAESLAAMQAARDDYGCRITVVLSRAGQRVIKWYRLWEDLQASFDDVKVEKSANVPFVAGPLQMGRYRLFYVSPATSNTVAKIAYGIADSLITNCVSQGIKGGTPVYICPVDQEPGAQEVEIPDGRTITITTRDVDVENVQRLRDMAGVTVLKHPAEIEPVVAKIARQPSEGAA